MASNVVFDDDLQTTDLPGDHLQDEVTMGRMLDKDAKRREVTTNIYDSLLGMLELKSFENFSSELYEEYNDYIKTMKSNRKQLQKKKCPIIVAGDTSAGKSSLVNLIIEEDLLPCGVLSSSSTITQIFNSEGKYATIVCDGKPSRINNVTKKILKDIVSVKQSEENMRCYERVDIFWPVPMLKDHACIVDTPGIGEFGKMSTSLQSYLSEAVAFIYVIDVSNSGGVHKDRIGKIFEKQRELEKKGSLNQFDPECAIFVCNKWDQVPDDEDVEVWEDVVKKLHSHWITRKNVDIREHMFKMSVNEDQRRRKAGCKSTDRFKSLISGFDRLVGACLERRVINHLNWLLTFLNRVLTLVIAKKNASRKTREKNEIMKIDVEKRLETLENKTENIKSSMKKKAEEICKQNAAMLTEYLKKEETIKKMFQWHDELPDYDDFNIMREKSIEMITDRINKHIFEWYQEYNIEEQWTSLFDQFIEECKLLKDNIRDIDLMIQGKHPLIPDEKNKNFTFGMKFPRLGTETSSIETFLLLLTAPFWAPLAVLAGLLRNVIEKKNEIALYKNNKTAYMNKLAEEVMNNYDKNMIYNHLRVGCLQNFMSNINHVCEVIIPNLIRADRELIKNILKEDRDSQTLLQEYTPIELQCKAIIGNVLSVKIRYFSDCKPCILREEGILGKGSYAEVLRCNVDFGDGKRPCAVKRLLPMRQSDHYLQLSEAENMMKLQHPNIVRCFDISISLKENEEYLEMFLEMCDCSLDDVFLCDNHPNGMCQCNSHRRKTCHGFEEKDRYCPDYMEALVFFTKILKDILNGLVYLHTQQFAHRDLKLSNILTLRKVNILGVRSDGEPKQLNLKMKLSDQMEPKCMDQVASDERRYSKNSRHRSVKAPDTITRHHHRNSCFYGTGSARGPDLRFIC